MLCWFLTARHAGRPPAPRRPPPPEAAGSPRARPAPSAAGAHTVLVSPSAQRALRSGALGQPVSPAGHAGRASRDTGGLSPLSPPIRSSRLQGPGTSLPRPPSPRSSPRGRVLCCISLTEDTEPLLSPAEHLLCISGYMCSILLGGRKKASAAYRVCKPPRSFPVACVLHSSYLCTPEEAWPCPPPWLTSRQPSSLLLLSVEAEQEAVQTPVPHRGLSRGRRSV